MFTFLFPASSLKFITFALDTDLQNLKVPKTNVSTKSDFYSITNLQKV